MDQRSPFFCCCSLHAIFRSKVQQCKKTHFTGEWHATWDDGKESKNIVHTASSRLLGKCGAAHRRVRRWRCNNRRRPAWSTWQKSKENGWRRRVWSAGQIRHVHGRAQCWGTSYGELQWWRSICVHQKRRKFQHVWIWTNGFHVCIFRGGCGGKWWLFGRTIWKVCFIQLERISVEKRTFVWTRTLWSSAKTLHGDTGKTSNRNSAHHDDTFGNLNTIYMYTFSYLETIWCLWWLGTQGTGQFRSNISNIFVVMHLYTHRMRETIEWFCLVLCWTDTPLSQHLRLFKFSPCIGEGQWKWQVLCNLKFYLKLWFVAKLFFSCPCLLIGASWTTC